MFVADNLRLRRADPNALPAVTERLRPPELHVHLHQLRRVVRRALQKLPEEHHLPRRQRGGVLGSEEQAQRSTRRLQGTGFHETSDTSFWQISTTKLFQMAPADSKTIFELRTERLSQLPLVDFLPADYGMPHQAFGFEVGPVCFN